MRKHFYWIAALIAVIINLTPTKVLADDHKGNTFFPIVQIITTPVLLCDNAGFSFLTEAGPRSYRFNGTLGYIACPQHRFKVGAEYLAQKLHFKFDGCKNHHWVHQWAVGGQYEYLIQDDCCQIVRSVELSGYYANSKSKELRDVQAPSAGIESRRIAGADTWNIEAGATFATWDCGYLLLAIDYDSVEYRRRFHHHHDVDGVGATVALHQPVWCDIVLDAKYQYKRAYDYIEGLLNWRYRMECGDLTLGVYANHVWGKDRLPSSTTVGGQIGFSFGIESLGLFDNCCNPCSNDCCPYDCCPYDCNDLAAWVSIPAVYLPQVLAITETCTTPTSATIPNQTIAFGSPLSFDVSSYFNFVGEYPVTFSATGLPTGFSIDSRTGVITGSNDNTGVSPLLFNVTVTATDRCGSTSSTFILTLNPAASG